MNFKRIIAGLLAIFMIVTQVPQAQITAYAAEDVDVLDNENEKEPSNSPVVTDEHDDCHDENCELHNHSDNQNDNNGNDGNNDNANNDNVDDNGNNDDAVVIDNDEAGSQDESADPVQAVAPFKAEGVISFAEKTVTFESKVPEYSEEDLGPKAKRIYDVLKPEFDEILKGEKNTDTENYIETSQLLKGELVYTYAELGVATGEGEDPVTDTALLNDAVKEILKADIQGVSEALFSGYQGTIKWVPAEVKFERDSQKVYIADAVMWTVFMDVKAPAEPQDDTDEAKEIAQDDLKDTDEEAKETESTPEDIDDDKDDDVKEDAQNDNDLTLDLTLDSELFGADGFTLSEDLLGESKLGISALDQNLTMGLLADEAELDGEEGKTGLRIEGVQESYIYKYSAVTIPNLQVYFGKKLLTEGKLKKAVVSGHLQNLRTKAHTSSFQSLLAVCCIF